MSSYDKNEVRRAYNRSQYIKRRKERMNCRSKHIVEAAKGNLSVAGQKGLRLVGPYIGIEKANKIS